MSKPASILLTLLLCWLCIPCSAQLRLLSDNLSLNSPQLRETVLENPQKVLDETSAALEQALQGTDSCQILELQTLMAYTLRVMGDADSAASYLSWLEEPRISGCDGSIWSVAHMIKAGIHLRHLSGLEAYKEYERAYQEALQAEEAFLAAQAKSLKALALFVEGIEEEGILLLEESIRDYHSNGYLQRALETSANLAAFYIQEGRIKSGENLLRKLYKDDSGQIGFEMLQMIACNLAFSLIEQARYAEATEILHQELEAESRPILLHNLYAYTLMAHAAIGMRDFSGAQLFLDRADREDSTGILIHHFDLRSYYALVTGLLAEQRQQLGAADRSFREAARYATPGKRFPNQEAAFEGMHRIALLNGDIETVQKIFESINHIKDSLFEVKERSVAELYKVREQLSQQQIQLRETEQALRIKELNRRLIIGGFLALAMLAVILFLGFRTKTIRARQAATEEHNKELSAYTQELEELAFVVSHNLLEGFRNISTTTALFTRKSKAVLSEEDKSRLRAIINASSHTGLMLRDLESYVSIGRSTTGMEETDLNRAWKQVIMDREAEINSLGITISQDTLPGIQADQALMIKLFSELIDNAIKYRREEPLKISLTSSSCDLGLRLVMADNGIGFPEEYSGKIFRLFQRLHLESNVPGTGIGLAIAAKIMAIYGGHISAHSQPGKGTQIIMDFPHQPKKRRLFLQDYRVRTSRL